MYSCKELQKKRETKKHLNQNIKREGLGPWSSCFPLCWHTAQTQHVPPLVFYPCHTLPCLRNNVWHTLATSQCLVIILSPAIMLVPRLAVRPEDIQMSVSLRRGDSLESQRVRRVLTRCRESAWSPKTSKKPPSGQSSSSSFFCTSTHRSVSVFLTRGEESQCFPSLFSQEFSPLTELDVHGLCANMWRSDCGSAKRWDEM